MTFEDPGSLLSDEEFHAWFAEQRESRVVSVERVPFAEAEGWSFHRDTGNLGHRSGRFFTVEGVEVRDGSSTWSQPVIDQPEIGILGILTTDFDGVPHLLMQAKFEPGNVSVLQLSPTVQATRSNFTGVHGGRRTPYVEYFNGSLPRRVVTDVLQSEQGQWFWRKRNRNMAVRVDPDVPLLDGYCWLSVYQVMRFLREENLVNMDARTVLACMGFGPPPGAGNGALGRELAASHAATGPGSAEPALHSMEEVTTHLIEAKTRCAWEPRLTPLNRISGWTTDPGAIADDEGREFRVIAARVTAEGREVGQWSQPLLEPCGPGLAVFLVRSVSGVLHVLAHALPQPGLTDIVEYAPTVQLSPSGRSWAEFSHTPFMEEALSEDPERVLYDTVLSEEGGRFHHAQTRYRIVRVDEDAPLREPEGYLWVTLGQFTELLGHAHYLNIEARTLLACAHSLWSA